MGQTYLLGLLYILSLCGLYELKRAFKNKDIELNYPLTSLAITLIFIDCLFYGLQANLYGLAILIVSIGFLLKDEDIKTMVFNVFSIFYLSIGFTSLYKVGGYKLSLLIFLVAFSTDTFAYLTGMAIGKRKLAPKISPNKSIEGSIGGIVGCVLICSFYLSYIGFSTISLKLVVLLALGSVVGQCGDLFASKLKRSLDIKDYGNVLPGHGGILDRFDSILFVGPFILAISKFL